MPPKLALPQLNHFMEKRVLVKLTCGRSVSGILRGVDQFMSIVLTDAVSETNNPSIRTMDDADERISTTTSGEKAVLGTAVIRGSTIVEIVAQLE